MIRDAYGLWLIRYVRKFEAGLIVFAFVAAVGTDFAEGPHEAATIPATAAAPSVTRAVGPDYVVVPGTLENQYAYCGQPVNCSVPAFIKGEFGPINWAVVHPLPGGPTEP